MPEASDRFSWIPFHEAYADALLGYRDDRRTLLGKLRKAIASSDAPAGFLSAVDDMEPLTAMGLVATRMKPERRLALSRSLIDEFDLRVAAPGDFEGVPVLNPMRRCFFSAPRGGEGELALLWEVAEGARSLTRDDNERARSRFMAAYDDAMGLQGVRWNLTIALYWMSPFRFVSLDEINRNLLRGSSFAWPDPAERLRDLRFPPTGADYLGLCDALRESFEAPGRAYRSFPELTAGAYVKRESRDGKNEDGLGNRDVAVRRFWSYAPGPGASFWDDFRERGVMGLGWKTGDLRNYDSRDAVQSAVDAAYGDGGKHTNASLALWQFANDISVGDVVYVKRGRSNVIGRGRVLSGYEFRADDPSGYQHFRRVEWTDSGDWPTRLSLPGKTLTDVTNMTECRLEYGALFGSDAPEAPDDPDESLDAYDAADFLGEAYLSEERYLRLRELLKKKLNVILEGPPGVGKTFLARRLAYSMMGEKDPRRVEMIQLHQNYSYEDFVCGYRPDERGGFRVADGVFARFCQKAAADPERLHFFIIDEINRGDVSKIFGELFMLIEKDKRGDRNRVRLPYGEGEFSVPENLCILGTMNTADRSLAIMDYALRRRFAFFEIAPAFDSAGFQAYADSVGEPRLNRLAAELQRLNAEISEDEMLGPGYRIGHSFLCGMRPEDPDLPARLRDVVDFELAPTLREYWYEDPGKAREWARRLRGALT